MGEEIVKIRISPQGDATVSVKGVKGKHCQILTDAFEKALGNKTSETSTAEMYEKPEEVHIKSRT